MLTYVLVKHNKFAAGRSPRSRIYQRLDEGLVELRESLGGLPSPSAAAGIWRELWFQEAHHSTALEGNTLVLSQVEALLAEGRALGGKDLSEYMEVRAYADAAQWVYGHAIHPGGWESGDLATLTELRYIHELAVGPVWGIAPPAHALPEEKPGGFRQHDIRPFPGGMAPPSWVEVPAAVAEWVASLDEIRRSGNQMEALADAHAGFERIHPFLVGNGRAGRLALNLILVRLGYPPAIIYRRDRARYLDALRRADRGDNGPLGELLARSIIDNLYRFVVPAVADSTHLVPLVSLATKTQSVTMLRAAIERGRLRAQKGADGQWRSSREWVAEYVASRYVRAPRRDAGGDP